MKTFNFADELRWWVLVYVTGPCTVLWCDRPFAIYQHAGHWIAQDATSGAKRVL